MSLVPAGRQRVTGGLIEDPADFCGKMAGVFGDEVYRKSTEGTGLGKSAGKELLVVVIVTGYGSLTAL